MVIERFRTQCKDIAQKRQSVQETAVKLRAELQTADAKNKALYEDFLRVQGKLRDAILVIE